MLPASIVVRNLSPEPWAFLRGEGRHSAIYIYRQTYVLSRILDCRMDQANHNLLMAVGGWGVLLPPCYRTAVLAYHPVPQYSNRS